MKMFYLLLFIILTVFITESAKSTLTKKDSAKFDANPDKSDKSIFDKVHWVKIKEKNGVILSMQKNKTEKSNHYKAEKIISSSNGEKLFENLMNFDTYSKIFPKTIVYKKIKEISKNKYLMYCQANFKPFKNRDYYTILEYSEKNKSNIKEWSIEWTPLGSFPEKFPNIKNYFRVKEISGRWKIREDNNKITITVELFNNFNLPVAKGLSMPFEKSSTIEMLEQLIRYTK